IIRGCVIGTWIGGVLIGVVVVVRPVLPVVPPVVPPVFPPVPPVCPPPPLYCGSGTGIATLIRRSTFAGRRGIRSMFASRSPRGEMPSGTRISEVGTAFTGDNKPLTSTGYTATFALLQALITAVSSDWFSGVQGNPAVSSTRLLRPGTAARFLTTLRRASSILRAPYSASDEVKTGGPPNAATSTGTVVSAFGTFGILTPVATCLRRAASVVKFCATWTAPP